MGEDVKIVLASTSKYRRALLDAAGIVHEAVSPPFVEEHAIVLPPDELVVAFARGKAESVEGEIVIGADQIPELDGKILTKPGTRDRAIEQLLLLQGRTHRLLTAVAVRKQNRTDCRLVVHRMTMRSLTRAQIERYVDRDSPLDCAGSYRIEAAGTLLFEMMEGPDHTAIVGLPLSSLVELIGLENVL
ncbi:MAG: Maf family protein [Polyangiales bacterium]